MSDMHYDVVVVGASLGGVAAAIRAGAMGASTCVLESSTWVGGQYTSQGVCKPDESRYVEDVGSNAMYREFRHRCRAHYRTNFRLSESGGSLDPFSAGSAYDSPAPRFAVEPKVADAILKQMLSEESNVHLRLQTSVVDAETAGDTIVAVSARGPDGVVTRFTATVFLDATDLGDLLPRVLARSEWVVGAEAAQDGERTKPGFVDGGPPAAEPTHIQPISVIVALEKRPAGENHTIAKPADYDALKASQDYADDDGLGTMFAEADPRYTMTRWNYRRHILAANFADPAIPYDRSTINVGPNDYQAASLPGASAADDAATIAGARAATLGYVYWLQTECPRDGEPGRFGYPELRPDPDAFGTPDGLAPAAYVRESRRIVALKTILRDEIRKPAPAETDAPNAGPRAVLFTDTCGIGTYAYMDVHALAGRGSPGYWIPTFPAQIPLRALIPKRVTNLIAACKNLGTTHFTNGLYRMHPIEWAVGEAAGALGAFVVANGVRPRDVPGDEHLLRAYQRRLIDAGVPLYWWSDVLPGDPNFAAFHLVGATGTLTVQDDPALRFGASEPLSDAERAGIEGKLGIALPAGALTRGQAAVHLFEMGLI